MTVRRAALVGFALLLTIALYGCGGSAHKPQGVTPGAGQPKDVRFTGGSVPGTVYLGVGPDINSLDAYRVSGPLSQTRRLTYSPNDAGLQGLAADAHAVVVDRLCCFGLEFLEQLNLDVPGGLPGTMLTPGTDPALAVDGSLAYARSDYQGCACDALLVRPSLLGRDRVVYRERHPGTIVNVVWSRQKRLAIIVGTLRRDGSINHPLILVDPGTPGQQTINPGPTWVLGSSIWFGPNGELSYQLPGKVVIRPPSGSPRTFLLNNWDAECWLQDGRIFMTDALDGAIGTLDPTTGAISTIGHFGHLNAVFVFDCPAAS
jgi:hypothetical protein